MMRKCKIYIVAIICIVLLCNCAHKSGPKQQNRSANQTMVNSVVNTQAEIKSHQGNDAKIEGRNIFQRYSSAVFMVFTSNGFQGYQGSGFFINSSGLAVSNYHVFKGTNVGAEQIKLQGCETPYKVTNVIASSEEFDFILFQTNCTNTNYIPIAKDKPYVGEKVYAIGSPRGLENTFSSGEVSQWRDDNLMQISALIDHGSSGGALINEYGEVVGITSGSFYDGSQANLNYAWSIDVVKPYINK